MKKKKNKLIAFAMMAIMVFSAMFSGGIASYAAEEKTVKIEEFKMTHEDLSTDPNYKWWESFKIELKFDASEHQNNLKKDDYFIINLPSNMKFPNNVDATHFDVKVGDLVMATGVVAPNGDSGGTVTVTFTDYVENHTNIKGDIWLNASFGEGIVNDQDNTFTVSIGSETASTTAFVEGPEILQNELATKWSWTDDDYIQAHGPTASWTARINHKKANLTNVKISDTLSVESGSLDGMHFIEDSFVLRKVTLDQYGNIDESQPSTWDPIDSSDITFNADKTTFEYALGDIGDQQYLLEYKTTYIEGKKLKNMFKLTANNEEAQAGSSYQSATSGGGGTSDLLGKIKLTKVDQENADTKLAGAKFTIKSADGNYEETFTTDENGEFVTGKLNPGDYTITEIEAPVGYEITYAPQTETVESDKATELTISNTKKKTEVSVEKVWNGDALDSVTVKLLADGAETDSIVLNAANSWKHTFADLDQYKDGNKIVYTVKEDAIADYTSKTTGTQEDGFVITNTKNVTPKYKLGDTVWYDDNKDGIQDDGEKGVKGVTVTLTKPDGSTMTTTTDADGKYEFEGLENGDYTVMFSKLPTGYEPTQTDVGDDAKDSDGLVVNATIKDENNLTIDLGIVKTDEPPSKYKLGNYVWYDDNKNGIQDDGEKGVPGVKVTLFMPNATTNAAITVTTDANGHYLFEGLENGTYELAFSDLPNGYQPTISNVGTNDLVDSDGLTPEGIIKDGDNLTIDLGIVKKDQPPAKTYKLGDYVWYDDNKNGIQDNGEKGVPGVKVTLFMPNATTNAAITVTTDANGKYVFEGLENGTYKVEFSNLPNGYQVTLTDVGTDDTKDSDGLSTEGIIKDADNMTLDLGIYQDKDDSDGGNSGGDNSGGGSNTDTNTSEPTEPKIYKLGNYVWYDNNKNGLQDGTEGGVKGVTVALFDEDGTKLAETTTDVNGRYIFEGLDNGTYTVKFSNLPADYQATKSDAGDDAKDSDGLKPSVTIKGADDTTIDLGIVKLESAIDTDGATPTVSEVQPTGPNPTVDAVNQLPNTSETLPVLPIAAGLLLMLVGASAYIWGKRTEY